MMMMIVIAVPYMDFSVSAPMLCPKFVRTLATCSLEQNKSGIREYQQRTENQGHGPLVQ